MVFLLALSVGVSYFSVVAASITRLRGWGLSWGNLTLQNYVRLFRDASGGGQAPGNSFGLALAAATLALVNKSGILGRLLDFLSLLPGMVPGIMVALRLILFWDSAWMPIRLSNTGGMVVLAYVVLFLPYTVQYVKAAAGQLGPSLAEAGRVGGTGPS